MSCCYSSVKLAVPKVVKTSDWTKNYNYHHPEQIDM